MISLAEHVEAVQLQARLTAAVTEARMHPAYVTSTIVDLLAYFLTQTLTTEGAEPMLQELNRELRRRVEHYCRRAALAEQGDLLDWPVAAEQMQ